MLRVRDGEADHSHAAASDCLTSEGLHQSVVDNGGALRDTFKRGRAGEGHD